MATPTFPSLGRRKPRFEGLIPSGVVVRFLIKYPIPSAYRVIEIAADRRMEGLVLNSPPLSLQQIEKFKQAGRGVAGEKGIEKIALAVLEHFDWKEVTVWDLSGTHQYFRIGAKGRHGIFGVHVHLPYGQFDPVKGYDAGPLRAGSYAVGLADDPQRPGTVNNYVFELLNALKEGRYTAGFGQG
jgi:hypothetical protein